MEMEPLAGDTVPGKTTLRIRFSRDAANQCRLKSMHTFESRFRVLGFQLVPAFFH
jgi:hypothetical protein